MSSVLHMAPHPQPDHNIEVQRFHQFLNEQSSAVCDSPIPCPNFIPSSHLKQYFQRERGSLNRLLRAVIEKEEDIPDVDTVNENYLAVFAILLSIGYGMFLPRFVECSYHDEKLPFEVAPPYFPVLSKVSLFDLFYARQWEFRPEVFGKSFYNKRLGDHRVLPIIRKEELKQSTPATIYKVILHADYDQLQEPSDQLNKLVKASKNLQHTYIFKEFRGAHAYQAYVKERTAFMHLRASQQLGKTIIGCYGSFSHKDSHVLILEYADGGTLDEYIKKFDPPSTGTEVMKLWESLITIQNALHTIHEIPSDSLGYTAETTEFSALRGWHSDLKPANILVVSGATDSPFDCQFRLADLGTSNFARLAQMGHDIHASDDGGTRQFGAPECYLEDMPSHRPRIQPQKADVWSLGCIYGEFAVWIVLGRNALCQYQEERIVETKKLGIKHVGCFHDGERPLQCVKRWSDKAFSNKRSSDHVTRSVLRKLVDEMLYPDADARPNTKQLRMKAKDIFDTANDIIAHPEKHASNASDSTAHLSYRFRANKRLRRHHAVQDDSSSDESRVSTPAVPSPSRQSTARNHHARQTANSLDTTFSDANTFATPDQTDTDHDTRDTTPISVALSPKSVAHFDRLKIGPGLAAEALRYSSEMTRSPDTLITGRQPPIREIGNLSGLPDAVMQNAPSHQQNNDRVDASPNPSAVDTNHATEPPTTPIPKLTLDRGLIYYSEKKAGRSVSLNDEGYMSLLAEPERDFMFLIDDSRSMGQYARRVYETVQLLAWLLKGYDKDGIEMFYMRSRGRSKSTSSASSQLLSALNAVMRKCQGTSDVTHRLGDILHNYKKRLTQSQQPKRFSISEMFQSNEVKPLSIYILTDGEWETGSDPTNLLRKMAQFLNNFEAPDNQLGIQFIRFGNGSESTTKLERLDSELGAVRDIVDTEPIDGNVFKMLLGPISRLFDGDFVGGSKGSNSSQ